MPVSPPPDRILTEFLAVFRTAELDLTRALAKAVERGTSTESLSVELAAATRLRQQVEAIQTRLRREVAQASTSMLTEAVLMGGRAAIADLDALLGPAGRDYDADFNRGALVRLARSLVDTLTPAITSITRTVDDVYRQVVGRAVSAGVVGSSTRREVTQRALDQFAARGVTSFTDVRGRRWQMDTYAEMAARTAMARAAVDAHTDRLAAEDIDLVHVSDSPQECPLCRPWEGKVLALDPGFIGPRTVQVEHMIQDDVLVSVEVAGSLEQARLAGLFHPNCTHAVSAYLPGVTKLPTATENPKGYEDKQHLRYLERNLRAARRREAAAITPAAKQRTARLVGRWLARLEEHVATSQAKRQLHREVPRSGVASRAEPDPVSPVFQRAERTDRPAEPRQLPSAERRQLEAPPAAAPEPSPQDAVQKLANELHATRPVRRTQRLRGLDGDTLQALIAEERRRAQLLGKADRMSKVEKAARAEVAQRAKPKPLAKLTMDELAERMNTALADGDMDAFDRLANEEDRRGRAQERRAQRAEAERERREQAQAETFEQLMTQGVDPEEADAIASGTTVEAMRRREVIRQLRESGYRGKSFDELARASFRDEVMDRYHRAEDATNGYLVNAEGRARAVDPLSLFTGPVARARKYASPELLEWFDQQGRLTLEEHKANLLGDSTSAARMRAERGDFYT